MNERKKVKKKVKIESDWRKGSDWKKEKSRKIIEREREREEREKRSLWTTCNNLPQLLLLLHKHHGHGVNTIKLKIL